MSLKKSTMFSYVGWVRKYAVYESHSNELFRRGMS